MNHVRAMTTTKFNEETGKVEIAEVIESRTTGFVVHSMIASTIFLLGVLKFLPTPIFSGIFLFLGRKLMTDNSFLSRIKDSIAEKNRLAEDHPIQVLGKTKMNIFTGIQVACLVGLWAFKENPATSILFPSAIGFLMLIRGFVLPRFFSEKELTALGDATPSKR
jgi:solute carrier family 4 (anion exchanger) protein 1